MIKITYVSTELPNITAISKEVHQTVFPIVVRFDEGGILYEIRIEPGFKTDLQSSPEFVKKIFRTDGPHRLACIVHDAAYRTEGFRRNFGVMEKYREPETIGATLRQYYIGSKTKKAKMSRKSCDQLYRALYMRSIETLDTPKRLRRTLRNKCRFGYAVLRMFGAKHFGGPIPNSGAL